VIDGLMGRLNLVGRVVRMRHLKPRYVAQFRGQPATIVVDPHGKPTRGTLSSLVKIWVWLFEEWYANFFQEKRETLLVCDRYFHDLLVDPMRYRFGAPLWTAELVARLMPRPKLWVLLDAPPSVLQSRKQEVHLDETARQCQAYLAFIRKQREYVIVDASQPLEKVIADVENAICMAVTEDGSNRG